MNKLKDRIILGVVAGLAGNAVKNVLDTMFVRKNIAEYAGPSRAAGMLVPAHKIATPAGSLVGWIADTTVGSMIGVGIVYALSISGKDKAALKGAILGGGGAWTILYGVLGTMGATKVQHPHPRTVLVEFLTHTVYGAVVGAVAGYLGDEALFTGELPWSARGIKTQSELDVVQEHEAGYYAWQNPNSPQPI